MTTMVDSYRTSQYGQLPHRKPLPVQQFHQPGAASTRRIPTSLLVPEPSQQTFSHSRTRTTSSSTFPAITSPTNPHSNAYTTTTAAANMYAAAPSPNPYQPNFNYHSLNRRTLSNATTSTTSTNTSGNSNSGALPSRAPGSSGSLRRSSSSRSQPNACSYVALMRKQKATVWCDRAQHEDPRLQAAQRAAKQRAAMEVVGGPVASGSSRSNTGSSGVAAGVRSKIRHHGAPKASLYAPANLASGGVPMRLSASEVDEGDSEDDSLKRGTSSSGNMNHHRSGSGRSSLGSGRRAYTFGGAPPQGRYSTSSTPPNGSAHGSSPGGLPEETPVPGQYGKDYFHSNTMNTTSTGYSNGSISSGERENMFGNLSNMPQQRRLSDDEHSKTSEELKRRGSVDDRTMTMSGNVRLFVANPDLSD